MNDVQSQDEFEFVHRAICKDLALERVSLEQYAAAPVSPVIAELQETLKKIISLVDVDGALIPDSIFRAGLEAMEVIDAKRFVLDNLLEGLKRGDQPGALIERYRELGLLNRLPPKATLSEIPSDADVTAEVLKGKGMLKRWGLVVAQIVVNAVRTIPKFVEIEPTISLVGPIPVVSFALKGKGMSIHSLFEALKGPGSFYRK
jgi:hypothetical protein